MRQYLVYRFTKDDHVAGPADLIECEDDEGAIKQATAMLVGLDIGIWEGRRFVTRLKSTETE
jgi:hypothetical protein